MTMMMMMCLSINGIGMVLIIDKKDVDKLINLATKLKYKPRIIGCIEKRSGNEPILYEKA